MRNVFINSFSIDSETERIIKEVAKRKGVSKSKALMEIVKGYDRHEKKKKDKR